MLGKTFEEDGQGQELYRWFYDNNETQPLYEQIRQGIETLGLKRVRVTASSCGAQRP